MKRYLLISSILACCSAALAADPLAKAPADTDSAAIFAAHKAWETGVQGQDVEDVVSIYTEDAVVLPPGRAAVRGRAGVQKFYADTFKDESFAFIRQPGAIEKDGSLAYTVGTYRMVSAGAGGKKTEESGNYVLVWKKQADGTWRIATDIWSRGT